MLGVTEQGLPPRRRLRALLSARSRLERLAALHTGARLFKWQHFYPIYDAHLRHLRGRPISLLEIGVGYGGSLALWRRYFGSNSRIVGVDIHEHCRRHARANVSVEIGDQGDPAFLAALAHKHGPFDVVIDDGSHAYVHQLTTFQSLFMHVKDGGFYACEDLCTSYWKEEFGGGVGQPGTYVEFLKSLVDEVNGWFWRENFDSELESAGRHLHGLHFYPALVVAEKRLMPKPVVTHTGADVRA